METRPLAWLPLALLVAPLFGLSCTDLGVGTNDTIDGRVIVRIFERYSVYGLPDSPTIFLGMQTERIYPCCNFSILADIYSNASIVTVQLKGIFEPEACLTALGPATYSKPLALPAGTYQLVVVNGSKSDRRLLEVTTSSIRISPSTTTVSVVPSSLTWRIPAKSFAYVCGTTVESAWMCDAFRDSLLSIPSLREFTFPDSGEVPYPLKSSGYWHNAPARYFMYAEEADFESAGALLKRYAHETIGNKQGIGMYLQNWRNITFRSWLL